MRQDVESAIKYCIMNTKFLKLALKEAYKAYDLGECPIGAVVVQNDQVIAKAHNLRENKEDPLGHAEILAIKKASRKLGVWRLDGCEMYVTLEPCLMCAGAIINSRISQVYFGAEDVRNGAVKNNLDTFNTFTHKPQYTYIYTEECRNLLTNFFKDLRFNLDISKIRLETKRLILRPLLLSDLDDFYEYAKVEGVGEAAGWTHHVSKAVSQAILESMLNDNEVLAIELKDNKKMIGTIGIHKKFYHEWGGLKYREIGYVLNKEFWHQGLMSEALTALFWYLFNDFKLDVLLCGHFQDNIRSQQVILKQNFKSWQTKQLKDASGKLTKAFYYYLTKEDLGGKLND